MWGGRGPYLPAPAPGLENPTALPLQAAQLAALSTVAAADRAFSVPDKDGSKDVGSSPSTSAFPMFRPGDAMPHNFIHPYHQIFRTQMEWAHAQALARAAHGTQQAQQNEESSPASIPPHPFLLNSHPSAFVPAAKRAKIEEREEGEIASSRDERLSERLSSAPATPASPSSRHSTTPDRASGLDLTMDSSHRGSPASNGQLNFLCCLSIISACI